MKTTQVKKLVLMLTTVASFLLLIPPAAAIQYSDDEDENGETIIINPEEMYDQGAHTRTPFFTPFEVTLLREQSLIHIEILSSMNNVTARLTNQSTGQKTIFAIGNLYDCYLPVSLGEGLYRLEFFVENGAIYYGMFSF